MPSENVWLSGVFGGSLECITGQSERSRADFRHFQALFQDLLLHVILDVSHVQCIRDFLVMRYINVRFTYLLTVNRCVLSRRWKTGRLLASMTEVGRLFHIHNRRYTPTSVVKCDKQSLLVRLCLPRVEDGRRNFDQHFKFQNVQQALNKTDLKRYNRAFNISAQFILLIDYSFNNIAQLQPTYLLTQAYWWRLYQCL